MNTRSVRYVTIADVTLLPAFILWFIWQLQFTARWTWMIFVVWMIVSFALHRDTPKTLGWRADNLWPATKQAALYFGLMILGLLAIGFALHAPAHLPPNLISWRRLWSYFAFCVLQQVLLNSLVHNRMLSLVSRRLMAAILTGLIFCGLPLAQPGARAAHLHRRNGDGLDVRQAAQPHPARYRTSHSWLADFLGVSRGMAPSHGGSGRGVAALGRR